MSVEVGTKAPDFTLKTKTAEGLKDITLSDNFGEKQTVLLFVPLAFTPVCTKELCTATSDYEQYAKLDAVIYGISIDSPFSQSMWAESAEMGIPLLSDMGKDTIRAYGVLDTELMGLGGVARRSAFVINKEGNISYKWIADEPQEFPDFDGIKRALGSTA